MMTSKPHFLVAFLSVLSLFAGCSFDGVKGSSSLRTEPREVAGFVAISFTSVGKLIVRQTGKESLTIQAEDNLLPLLESRVEGVTLHLGTVKGARISPTKPIEYVVEVKKLEGLHVSGAGTIEATDLHGRLLSVSISGVGNVRAAGNADELKLELSGVGSYDGAEFKTKRAAIRSSGVGSSVVNASEHLDITLSGVGTVEYLGSPRVEQTVSGVGKVRRR